LLKPLAYTVLTQVQSNWAMETRSQTRAREGQSLSSPVSSMEDSVPRPSSSAGGSEGDLGLSTLLGDGEASIVGRRRASESAISGPCDVTSGRTGPRQ